MGRGKAYHRREFCASKMVRLIFRRDFALKMRDFESENAVHIMPYLFSACELYISPLVYIDVINVINVTAH